MIFLKYLNAHLKIGMLDWRTLDQFPQQQKMLVELHQGKLEWLVGRRNHGVLFSDTPTNDQNQTADALHRLFLSV